MKRRNRIISTRPIWAVAMLGEVTEEEWKRSEYISSIIADAVENVFQEAQIYAIKEYTDNGVLPDPEEVIKKVIEQRIQK